MSNRVDAGITTAYGAAVRGGYTGTYDEFCEQQAEYAQNAEALEAARVQAVNAQIDANQSKVDAAGSATAAAESASAASQSASQAAGSATAAANSATSIGNAEANCNASMQAAQAARNEAQTARTGAESARDAAQTARTGAETARTGAESAETDAETARDLAQTAATASQAARDTAINTVGLQYEDTKTISTGTAVGFEVDSELPDPASATFALIATGGVKLTQAIARYATTIVGPEGEELVWVEQDPVTIDSKEAWSAVYSAGGAVKVGVSVSYTGTGTIRFVVATGMKAVEVNAEVVQANAAASATAAQRSATEAVYAEAQASFSASAAASSASDAQDVLDSIPDDYSTLANTVSEHSEEIALQEDSIPGTTQTITFDADGNVQRIVHSSGNTAVRTDVFTFGADTITEVRTLASGASLTIVTNTDTLVTTVTMTAA